jgi:hypothetical protein
VGGVQDTTAEVDVAVADKEEGASVAVVRLKGEDAVEPLKLIAVTMTV